MAKGDIRLRINDILGAFMFGGEASEKKVKVLSGGERSRLAMIRLLLEPVNLLILDEPTNHLDMQSKDVLKEAIKAFDGTAIVVSHDREFLDGLVTKVYEFGGGKVREHLGGIYDFLRHHNIESLDALSLSRNEDGGMKMENTGIKGGGKDISQSPLSNSQSPKLSYAEHKEQQKKIRKAEKAVKESEAKIETLEQKIRTLDAKLCLPEYATDMDLIAEYTETKRELDEENDRWMLLSEQLEDVKAEQNI